MQTGKSTSPPTFLLTYHMPSFVDRDAFARFAGIGIGCQRLQASHVLEIIIGPDPPDTEDPVTGYLDHDPFAGLYTMDDDDSDSM